MSGVKLPPGDPMLTRLGVVEALKWAAQAVDGRTDPDAVVEWAVNVGYLAPHPRNRGELCLTERGGSFVWLFWKSVGLGMQRAREQGDAGGGITGTVSA